MGKILVVMIMLLCGATAFAKDEGRWKSDGNGGCYWDESDGGPDQCDPNAAGRWKVGGDGSCYWDQYDSGPNQCAPNQPAAVTSEEEETANRLAAAAATLQSWGIDQNNVRPHDLPWILVALETQGFTFGITSEEAFRLVNGQQYDRYAGPDNCVDMQRKMARLKEMNRAFTEAAWLWGAGGGILTRIGASPPVLSVVAVGAAVSAMAATVTSWMIQDYQNAPCVT